MVQVRCSVELLRERQLSACISRAPCLQSLSSTADFVDYLHALSRQMPDNEFIRSFIDICEARTPGLPQVRRLKTDAVLLDADPRKFHRMLVREAEMFGDFGQHVRMLVELGTSSEQCALFRRIRTSCSTICSRFSSRSSTKRGANTRSPPRFVSRACCSSDSIALGFSRNSI